MRQGGGGQGEGEEGDLGLAPHKAWNSFMSLFPSMPTATMREECTALLFDLQSAVQSRMIDVFRVLVSTRSFSSSMLTMFNFVYTGENFGDVIFTDSTSGLATVFFVIVSFLGNLVVLSQLVGSFQNHYGTVSEKGDLYAEAKQRARRRQGYLCVYAQLAVR